MENSGCDKANPLFQGQLALLRACGGNSQNLLNLFESKQKRIQEAIYWVTLINRTGTGARFRYLIYSVSSGKLLDQLDSSMQAQFVWRI